MHKLDESVRRAYVSSIRLMVYMMIVKKFPSNTKELGKLVGFSGDSASQFVGICEEIGIIERHKGQKGVSLVFVDPRWLDREKNWWLPKKQGRPVPNGR